MKVVNTPILLRLAANGRRKQFNKQLPSVVKKQLDPRGLHVLSHPIVHGDAQCVRLTCVMLKVKDKDEPVNGMLDVAFDDWNALPEHAEAVM